MKFRSTKAPASVSAPASNQAKTSSSKSMKFDEKFYRVKYPDINISGVEPHKHYIEFGIKEGRWPHPYFDPQYYTARYHRALEGIADVFTYFLESGLEQGHIPIPVFAPRWYGKNNADVRESGLNPFLHFIEYGDIEGRHPSSNFDSTTYLKDIGMSSITAQGALRHWLMHKEQDQNPQNEILRQLLIDANFVDSDYYLDRYKDVYISGGIPLEHFILHGARELRAPNPITDMRLINLISEPQDKSTTKFQYYMENVYKYELDHLQNNYQLWRTFFDYKIGEPALYSEDVLLDQNRPVVAAVISVDEGLVDQLYKTIESLNESKGVSVRIYIAPRDGFSSESIARLKSIASKINKVELIKGEKEFRIAASDCNYILFVTTAVIIDTLAISIMLRESRRENALFMYSDHDHIKDGFYQRPEFKPKFSRSYLSRQNYCGNVLFARRSERTDQALVSIYNNVTSANTAFINPILSFADCDIGHVPFILYHEIDKSGIKELNYQPEKQSNITRDCSVTIIIPMRDKYELTKSCIESILTYSNYPRDLMSIVVVNNDSVEAESLSYLSRLSSVEGITVIDYNGTFNFSKINNYAASQSDSSILVFLNNDTSVIDEDWLGKLVYYASMPKIGAVGAKLLYEDGTIQHGGCVVGAAGGFIEHLLVGQHSDDASINDNTREMSVITGACLAIESSKFRQLGGFNSALRVAWNDVFLCLSSLELGYRNIYLSDPILYHYESKSRGFDSTPEKLEIFTREAAFTRKHFQKYFLDDPSYNSNLSLESAGKLALPPRTLKPWLKGQNRPKRVLMLSCVYNVGYGVPVVMERHAQRMVQKGWDVHIGGPLGTNEIQFDGCKRAIFSQPSEAATYAYMHDISVIVSHTPPFFRITDYVGSHTAVICYDYGEPNPKLFDVATMNYLENVNRDKLLAFSLATRVVAISNAVKSEGKFIDTSVVGLGNDHLSVWSDGMIGQRDKLRRKFGWGDKKVILNVCRFPKTERYYKGLDKYVDVMNQFNFTFGANAENYIWVLAGAAGPNDVSEMKGLGLEVFANLTNDDLADLYKAVDVYMSFSKWEGYNLGIGQALAMGLPVVASDIEAHREFPIFTSNSSVDVAVWLKNQSVEINNGIAARNGTVFRWSESADKFESLLSEVFSDVMREDSPHDL